MAFVQFIADLIYAIACVLCVIIGIYLAVFYFEKGLLSDGWPLLAAGIWFCARLLRYVLTGK
jgi:hypothetical protein